MGNKKRTKRTRKATRSEVGREQGAPYAQLGYDAMEIGNAAFAILECLEWEWGEGYGPQGYKGNAQLLTRTMLKLWLESITAKTIDDVYWTPMQKPNC